VTAQVPRSLTLYWGAASCARVSLIALEEIGVPFTLEAVPKGERARPPYSEINPKGKVPLLVADGRQISENPAIQLFLARAFPAVGLLPREQDAELEALSTMCWFASGIHPQITRARFPASTGASAESLAAVRAHAVEQLAAAFTLIEGRLADREWLLGDWSIVDAYLFWLWFRATGSGMDASAFPRCAGLAARIVERPSVARALERELEHIPAEDVFVGAAPAL
jgi:glutathione S-transferase